MATYNKLVRDKIPEILDKKGVYYEKRIASIKEYKKELIKNFLRKFKSFQRLKI